MDPDLKLEKTEKANRNKLKKLISKRPRAWHNTHEEGAQIEMAGARYIVAKDGSYRRVR